MQPVFSKYGVDFCIILLTRSLLGARYVEVRLRGVVAFPIFVNVGSAHKADGSPTSAFVAEKKLPRF